MSTLINFDPWKYMPDDSLMESGKPVRSSGDRVAMCQHSTVDAANCLAVEMSYAWVLLDDCWRLEATTRETMQRHKVGSTRQEYPGPRHLDADADYPKSVCIAHDQHDIPHGFGPEWIKLHYGLKLRTSFDLSQIEWQARSSIWRQVPSRVTGTVLHPGDWINQAEVEQVAQPQVQFADDLIDYQLEFLDEVVATLIDRWLDSVLVGEST